VVEVSHVGRAEPQPGRPAEGVVEVWHGPDHAAVAEHARRQRGRVTLAQLRDAGRGRGAVRHDNEKGRLHREHRAVYAVGHDADARWAAEHGALLAQGDDSFISFRSGLEVWGVLAPQPRRDVDVVARTPRAHRDGITVHRTRRIDPRDITRRYDLRVARPERALLDAAEQLDDRELEIALNELLAKGLTTAQRIYELLARSPGRKGAKRLKALLNPDDGYTRNNAERLLRTKVMPHTGLKRVIYNARIGPYYLDAYVPSHGVGIEVDGYNPHKTPKNFARDLERQNDLKTNYGIELLRFAYRTIRDRPEKAIADIARATPSPGTTRA
jgi:very-short-patch-repair endonuclease